MDRLKGDTFLFKATFMFYLQRVDLFQQAQTQSEVLTTTSS